jgi:tetratricopeptide (TPR) repeat protein
MKNLAVLFFLFIFALTAIGQTPQTTPKKQPKPARTVVPKLGTETEEFEKAKAVADPTERIKAFQNFIVNFPESAQLGSAELYISTARVELGVVKFQANDTAAGIEFYKLAVQEAPTPVPDEIFSKVLIGMPVSLFALNQRTAAFDIAKLIEEKVGGNANQILGLSKFYLNAEYGTEAIRLAQKAIELAPDSASAYQTLALANRLNFMLEDAAVAYTKSLELDGESVPNRLGLAEMKRALGKPDEAAALYREALAKEPDNKAAQSGLTLALFDTGKRADAEAELKKALEADPENARLMTSIAYWYAARGLNEQAIEYAQKAIKIEPRNVWSYIAQSRALLAQNKPLESEKILLAARQYSDFPTLDYELASVRLAAGLYREAAETLKRSFAVNKDGLVEAYLGNRILADANSFSELLSLERRAALYEMKAADTEDNTAKLKALLAFNQRLEAKDATEDELALAAEEFAKGGDNMRLHRQIFAANRLLAKKTALPKVIELMQSAIGGVDGALNVASPSAAVLADQIYDDRQFYITQNLVVVVPEIPRPTLSAILRGQIEDIAGRALLQQNNAAQSVVRLKRAMSVLPDKSAWQRTSSWHLGEALQADGKEKEALDAFIKGYDPAYPNADKRAFIENLYVKINGSADGLDERIGAKTETNVAKTEVKPEVNNTDNVKTTEPTPEIKPPPTPEIKPERTPESVPTATPETTPAASPSPETTEIKEPVKVEPAPVETPKTDEVKPAETDEVKTEPSPTPTETLPAPETKPEELNPEEVKSDEPKPVEKSPVEVKPAVTAEPSPTPQNVSVVITDNLTPKPTATRIAETKTENKPTETTSVRNPTKPLFEPVIISVGKNDNKTPEKTEPNRAEIKPTEEKPAEAKTIDVKQDDPVENVQKTETELTTSETDEKPAEAEKPAEEKSTQTKPAEEKPLESKPVETVTTPEVVITDTLKPENKPAEKPFESTVKNPAVIITDNLKPDNRPTEKPDEKQPDEKLLSGENRPRIIITENTGAKSVTEEISGCKLMVKPESLSLLNGGGSLGVMVGFEAGGDPKQITAVSSSTNDVEVIFEPEIGIGSGRAFFVIKSVSTKTGIFTVTFEAPCGKKEILIKVR